MRVGVGCLAVVGREHARVAGALVHLDERRVLGALAARCLVRVRS